MSWKNDRDFLSWYKRNYNKDYEGEQFEQGAVSDEEYKAGLQLYKGYLESSDYDRKLASVDDYYRNTANSLLRNYSLTGSALEENKRTAQQNASITYDKLKKYLPAELKSQGYGNHAATESAMLEAENNYMNAMGNIAAEHSKAMSDVELDKNDALAELEKYKRKEITDINDDKDAALRDAADAALDAYDASVEEKNEEDKTGKSIALESTIIPKLAAYQENEEWEKGLEYLQKYQDYFSPAEYEVQKDIFEENAKEQRIILGKDSFTASNGKKMAIVGTPLANINDFYVDEMEDELAQKGFENMNDPRIPNGTVCGPYPVGRRDDGSIYYEYIVFYAGNWYAAQENSRPVFRDAMQFMNDFADATKKAFT